MANLLWNSDEWTFDLINRAWVEIDKIGKELNLKYHQPQIEIISSEQMIDLYTSIAMPQMYNHWSFGKQFVQEQFNYQKGYSGLAYEIVSNIQPPIAYLMENNTMTIQALVLAHASCGHAHYFSNNYLFKDWTDASSITDYLTFAKKYIREQEIKHGLKEVEVWIDSCHALMNYGVDRYKRPAKISLETEIKRQKERNADIQKQVTEFYRIIPKKDELTKEVKFPSRPEENLLKFFEHYSPEIKDWQREILRIVRTVASYFRPQSETKTTNEGFATYTHYNIMNILHDRGMTSDGSHLEFLDLHSGVLFQPTFEKKYYNGINPYALGFAMLRDIERICKNPTEEDKKWFPSLIGKNHWEVILDSVENYRDESFIRQFLSPKVIRDFKLFSVHDDRADTEKYTVTNIHNERGYEDVREKLAEQHTITNKLPNIEVVNVDKKTRTLYLEYTSFQGRSLDNYEEVFPHIERLWGNYPVVLHKKNGDIIKSTNGPSTPEPSNSYDTDTSVSFY